MIASIFRGWFSHSFQCIGSKWLFFVEKVQTSSGKCPNSVLVR